MPNRPGRLTRAQEEVTAEDLARLGPGTLDGRERDILERHIVRGEPYVAIARDLGVTKSRVWWLARRALARVRPSR